MTGHCSAESRVFVAATPAIVVHALDDAVLHRQPGLAIGQHALAAVIALLAGIAGAVAFQRLRPALRAASRSPPAASPSSTVGCMRSTSSSMGRKRAT